MVGFGEKGNIVGERQICDNPPPDSLEKAAVYAVEQASEHLKDLRIAEVAEMDMQIAEGKVVAYRTKVKVSFRYHPSTEG